MAIDFYWDANGAAAGTGGTGTWTTNNLWRSGSSVGTLGNWTSGVGNNAFFEGTAGVVSIGSTAVTAGTSNFLVTGYTLQTDASATTRTYTGAILLGDSVNLNLMDAAATASRTLNIGSVSGGVGSSLTIQGAQTAGVASRINLAVSGSTISVPTTISSTGVGLAGYVATNTNISINGIITNNSTATTILGATSGNALALNAKVTGSAGLMFAAGTSGGAGTITLNAANDYTGATIFNAANSGVIKLGITNALPTGTNVTMANSSSNGGILDLNGFDQTIASLTSGSGGGSITNGGAAGGSNSNTLTINGSNSPAAFGLAINNGANRTTALERSGSGSTILTGTSTFTGGTTVSGTSTLTLGHATNTLADTGAVTISGGTLALGTNTDTVGAVTLSSGSITGTGAGTLTGSSFALTGTGMISAKLAGNGAALTKSNAGTVTLSGANTYTGATTVTGGTLALGASGSINHSTLINVGSSGILDVSAIPGFALASGQTLTGGGTVNGDLTVAAGSTISPGASPGTLNVGATTLTGGGNYNWQLFDTSLAAGIGWDLLTVTGALDITATLGNKFNINLWTLSGTSPDVNGNALNFNNTSSYSWTLATASGGITGFDAGAFNFNTAAINGTAGFANSLGGGTFSLAQSGNNLNLLFTPGATNLYWTGAGAGNPGTWNTTASGAGGDGIWDDANVGWVAAKTANFAGAAGAVTVTTATANKGLSFSTDGYALTGGVITLSSVGTDNVITTDSGVTTTMQTALSTSAGVTKAGLGTLVLTSAQTYSGGTTVTAGTLQFGNGAGNDGSVTGDILNNSSVAFANTNAQTYAGAISGSGSLSKSAAGNLTLSNSNSFSGGTIITDGTLTLGHATDTLTGAVVVNGGSLDVGSNNDTVGAVTLTSGSIIGSGGTLTGTSYSVNNPTGTTTISANLGGAVSLTKTGAGNLTLSGTNTYSGGTVLNGGITFVASNANLGDSAGSLTFGGGTLGLTGSLATTRPITVNAGGGTIATGGNNFSVSSNPTINGTLATTGAGNVTFTGSAMTFGASGAFNIGSGGSVTIAGTASTITMSNGGVFDGDLIIDNTTGFRLNGAGKTYGGTGSIYILGSSLGVGSGGFSGTAFTNFNSSITNTSATPGGTITSNIVLNPADSGNLTGHVAFAPGVITGANYTSASFLAFIGVNSASQTLTIDGIISGDGDLYIGTNSRTGGGAGNLILNAANTYTGNTLINSSSGTANAITLGTHNALPTTTNVIFASLSASGSSVLDLNGFNQEIASLTDDAAHGTKVLTITNKGTVDVTLKINGSVTPGNDFGGIISNGPTNKIALVKDGSNTLTLTGVNTFTGGTTISGGTLKLGSGNILADTGAVLINGGILDLQSDDETVGAFTITSGSVIGTGILTASSYDIQGGTLSTILGGSAAVSITSGGTLGFTGSTPTNYSNNVTVGAGNGIISNTGTGALTLSGDLTKNGTNLTLGGTGRINVTGSILGTLPNSDLIVDGATVVVSTNQNYNGPTTVQNSGTFVVNAEVTTTQLNVNSGSTVSGTGSIENGAGLVYLNGALVVGDSTLGSPVVSQFEIGGTGSIILGATSSLVFDLFTGDGFGDSTAIASAADRLKLFGTLDATLGGTLVIGNPSAMTGFANGDMWTLFDFTGGGSISGTFAAVDYSALGLAGGLVGMFDSNTGVFSVVAIPEPSRAVLIAIGLIGLIQRRRR